MNEVTLDGCSREQCALAVTQCYMDELADAGFLAPPHHSFRMTEEGKEFVRRLKAAGFDFNPGELEMCTLFLASPLATQMAEQVEAEEQGIGHARH